MKQGIDVCICTYNRLTYLQQCVERLIPQLELDTIITVIDNNSNDGTKEYIQSLSDQNLPVRYFSESQQGLSQARNKGWRVSDHDWVFYIDDDCLPAADVISKAIQSIGKHPDVSAIGGPVSPVFSQPLPEWLPAGFGEFHLPYDAFTVINTEYIRGGNFLVKRNALVSLNGFMSHLGVKGDQLSYGEEIELQDRMRAAGHTVGYEPSMKMGHYVRSEKMNPVWILRSNYARRRDKMLFDEMKKSKAAMHLVRTLGGRIIWTPIHLTSIFTKKKYFWQNAVLDILDPLAYSLGEFVGAMKRHG